MSVERGGWTVRALKLWIPLGAFMVFTLFPFYWMAVTSLKPNSELYNRKIMPLIVYHPTLKHYVDSWWRWSRPRSRWCSGRCWPTRWHG